MMEHDQLFKIANELGINFYEAREYANHEYCHIIYLPSTGVGGYCIPVYPWFLITFRKGIKELYNSKNLALAKLLMKESLNVFVYDGLRWVDPDEADIVFDCFELKIVRSI